MTATTWGAPGLEVDEQSITVLRYAQGLSKMETRRGTLTDPWTQQPQPKCGFVVVGSHGTISSYACQPQVTLQTRAAPVQVPVPNDPVTAPDRGPVKHVLHAFATGGARQARQKPAQ